MTKAVPVQCWNRATPYKPSNHTERQHEPAIYKQKELERKNKFKRESVNYQSCLELKMTTTADAEEEETRTKTQICANNKNT